MRWPIGDSSGHISFAIDSLMTATGMRVRVSRLSSRRPCAAARRNVSKYDGLAVTPLHERLASSSSP